MMSEKIKKLLNRDFSYPDTDDEDFQNKIYEKREFYYNRHEEPKVLTTYPELKKYRENICGSGSIKTLQPHQAQVASLFTPNTPLRGAVLFWDTGSGKTCAGVSIAENFKDMVTKYGTKIHILVPGRLIKEEWKRSIIACTKETYLKDLTQSMGYVGDDDKELALKQARNNFSQYYKIMSHVGFAKKALGQKIIEHVKEKGTDKINKIYRKTSQGDYERDVATDKIESLDNSVLIVDEAHHITGNDYGTAVRKVIQNSKNLRVFMLSATPMKNLADDFIELINFIRPETDQIDKDLVFTNKSHLMAFKPGGKEYLGKMMQGYISYAKGANSYLYAKQVDMGEIPKGLMFTRVTQCNMHKFQQMAYIEATENNDDTLDRKATAVSNFAFPYFCHETGKLIGKYGIEGINALRTNIKTQKVKLYEELKKLGVKGNELIVDNDKLKTIGGDILKRENLHIFSTKFTECIDIIKSAINDNAKLGFIYSNFVKTGIELFEQVLLMNGFLEYDANGNYNIKSCTRHYLTGEPYEQFIKKNKKDQFYPSTFISVTGGTEDGDEQIPEEKKRILDMVFSIPDNKEGKYIKLVLGSKVMTEGITLKNIGYIVVLDTHYHLGQIVQVVGRGIRFCVHNAVSSEDNPYPEVKIYKLIVKGLSDDELSTEGILYQKAEQKYLLVKDCERLAKENAIDCPTNYNANISKSDIKDYEGCIKPLEYAKLGNKDNVKQCPMKCDFQDCLFKCAGKKLNLKHYDKNSKIYKKIPKGSLDFSTFTNNLARNEINFCKDKIKEIYRFKYIYNLEEIVEYVKNSFTGEQYELFEEFFCYKALDELILITENDFNNFHDFIYDKNTVPGYLIYRSRFYIFQPINEFENVPMYYRTNYIKDLKHELTLNQYFKNTLDTVLMDEFTEITSQNVEIEYDFDNVLEYYDTKDEAKYVGIIDKPIERKKTVKQNLEDIFKIREKKSKTLSMKRGTGIPSLKGSVCFSSKDKKYLIKVAKAIGLSNFDTSTRTIICNAIRLRMLYLEKYSTNKDNNKLTWLIIPFNHPIYIFPLNLEDRVQQIINNLEEKINVKVQIKDGINGIFENIRDSKFKKYDLTFKGKPEWDMYNDLFIKLGFKLSNNVWTMTVE
jgi:superfamily II DNA or RNA helicase